MSKGGGAGGGAASGAVTCVEGQNLVGDSSRAGTAAALLGAVACIDVAAVAYRATLSAAVAGTSLSTNNLYGPFEAGFSSNVPGMGCLGSNTVQGGLDTMTSGMIVHHLCNDNTVEVLGVCGDHASPSHFHEFLEPYTGCLTYQDAATGHSSRIGTAADGLGIYGPFSATDTYPQLDACGATFGVAPDSNGVAVAKYHVQMYPRALRALAPFACAAPDPPLTPALPTQPSPSAATRTPTRR